MTDTQTNLTIERQVYTIVDEFKDNIPLPNDRNRLAFCLYKYVKGEGDSPEILVKTTKIKIKGISEKELGEKLKEKVYLVKKEG
ncbi:MAG: hypothetical protein IIB07_10495 [Bacteroidetes bacterium]|nr:hypothetical protein [Bacteroidota bacterium]MCH8171538.1 hypothetical protein [Bacteroidota bacterium]MCH8940883.1 hypothetical protein [Bacteroidota bacterium]